MNDYSSYSSAPPSEASAAAAYNSARCQTTIDNVTRWLQQYESETEQSESRANLFEAELTRRLSMLRATGANTPSSLSRNVSEQSIARPQEASPAPIVHLVRQPLSLREGDRAMSRGLSTASASNKRGFDTCPAGQSKQPRISDPTLATDIPFQPAQSLSSIAVINMQQSGHNNGMLTPPSSAANSMDNAPPLPPRESVTSSSSLALGHPRNALESAPPLPPRPAGLVTSGVELHMSSPTPSTTSNMAISFTVSNKLPHGARLQSQQQQQGSPLLPSRMVFESRGYSTMPPAPPASVASTPFSPDSRVHSLPSGAAPPSVISYHHSHYGPSHRQGGFHPHFQVFANGSPVPLHYWTQTVSSTGASTTPQSHAFSNLNYSVFPEYSQNGADSFADQTMSVGSVSISGSNYAFHDQAPNLEMERINLTDSSANPAFSSVQQPPYPHQQQSSRHLFIHANSEPRQLPPQVRHAKVVTTSPLPERRQRNSARLEDGTIIGPVGRESYSNTRNYSSEAYKFFMEQHIENLVKSSIQRKERQQQFDAFLATQNLNETERRRFRSFHAKRESTYLRLKRARLQPSFFEPLKTLGIGAFGEVSLVRKRDTGKLYAMKTLRKADVIKRNQVAHVKAERDILAEANSDWVVKLFFSFQDRENLYFIMDYIPGGDLMNLLMKKGIFSEAMARFYTAELVCALEYVHSMGFIHRDIKPDNVLIDREGHVKLTDFGLCTGFRWTHQSNRYAKIRPEEPIWFYAPTNRVETPETNTASSLTLPHGHRRVHSLVGTPNYIAPEVVLKSGYNHSCDWWSVGVILYEMLVGRPPFLSDTPAETQYKIIHWKHYLGFPPGVGLSPASADLIFALIRDADSRLGAYGGAADIKAHAFFNSIDFENLRKQPAIYVPILKNEMDTSNFDPSNQGGQASFTDQAGGPIPSVGPAAFSFYEFTFRRFCDDAGCPLPPLSAVNSAQSMLLSSLLSPNAPPAQLSTSSDSAATAAAAAISATSPTTSQPPVVGDAGKPPLPPSAAPPPLPPRPVKQMVSNQSQQPTVAAAAPASVAAAAAAALPKPLPPPAGGSNNTTNPTFV